MAIKKAIGNSNGLSVVHAFYGVHPGTYDPVRNVHRIEVRGFPSEEAWRADAPGNHTLNWQEHPYIPAQLLGGEGNVGENVEKWLIENDPVYAGGTYLPLVAEPVEKPIEQVKDEKTAEINAAFHQAAEYLTAGYPAAERQTWYIQEAEARAWYADNSTPTPFLDAIAADRGMDPVTLRERTLANVQVFQAESAKLIGTRQRLIDAINAEGATIETLNAIAWPQITIPVQPSPADAAKAPTTTQEITE